jgi:hypothetical protein
MIFPSEHVIRALNRIDDIMTRDIKNGTHYYSSMTVGKKTYTGTDLVKQYRKRFRKFKASVEDGTCELLKCDLGKEDHAKVQFLYELWRWCEPLSCEDWNRILGDVFVQRKLRSRLEEHVRGGKVAAEAKSLLRFINNAYGSSWGQQDSDYRVRDFRLVETEEEFEELLHSSTVAEELTRSRNLIEPFNYIRVMWIPDDFRTVHKQKGIFEDYNLWAANINWNEIDFGDAIKAYNLWHGVTNRANYFVYIPKCEPISNKTSKRRQTNKKKARI